MGVANNNFTANAQEFITVEEQFRLLEEKVSMSEEEQMQAVSQANLLACSL